MTSADSSSAISWLSGAWGPARHSRQGRTSYHSAMAAKSSSAVISSSSAPARGQRDGKARELRRRDHAAAGPLGRSVARTDAVGRRGGDQVLVRAHRRHLLEVFARTRHRRTAGRVDEQARALQREDPAQLGALVEVVTDRDADRAEVGVEHRNARRRA